MSLEEGEEEDGGGDGRDVESGDPEDVEVELSSDDEIGGVGKAVSDPGCERAPPLL